MVCLLDIDVQGVKSIMEVFGSSKDWSVTGLGERAGVAPAASIGTASDTPAKVSTLRTATPRIKTLSDNIGSGDRPVYVFVRAPSLEIMEQRLRNRGTETEEKIRLRVRNAGWEQEQVSSSSLFPERDNVHFETIHVRLPWRAHHRGGEAK